LADFTAPFNDIKEVSASPRWPMQLDEMRDDILCAGSRMAATRGHASSAGWEAQPKAGKSGFVGLDPIYPECRYTRPLEAG